jgi:hypothetical protein
MLRRFKNQGDRMKRLVGFAAILPLVSGCAHMQSRAIAYQEPSASQLYVWRSDYSAGIGNEGKICAQAATTARATGASADASLSTSVLAAVAPQLATLPPSEAAALTASLQQSVMLTNSTNGQTAYSNIAFFYLCQISLNAGDKLSAADIVKMWSEVNATAPKIGTTNSGTSNIDAQAPVLPQAAPTPAVVAPEVPVPSPPGG